MKRPLIVALGLWLAVLAGCGLIIANTRFVADLSAFLPKAPNAEQKVLVEQLREGVVARLLLVGIEGGSAEQRHELSRSLAASLRQGGEFSAVQNGEAAALEKDRAFFFEHRYLLSDQVTPARFEVAGLRAAVGDTLDWLSSPAGLMIKAIVPRDPTGETLALIEHLQEDDGPRSAGGVWVSADDSRAVLLLQTRASGEDTDGQAAAIGSIQTQFERLRPDAAMRIEISGPSVFAVNARDTIKNEVARIASLSTLLIATLLLFAYRSLRLLLLGQLPVITGAAVGVASVSLGFGHVHGLTLGFGVTLIGEAIDYAIYLFVQGSDGQAANQRNFWRTVRIGVATSVCGFGAMLVSGFPGLAQLGLYSISGIIAAALVTRYILPQLMPQGIAVRDHLGLGARIAAVSAWLGQRRWIVLLLVVLALGVLSVRHDNLWNREISALSPVNEADKLRDTRLRADLGAPDSRYMLSVRGATQEEVLQACEALAPTLNDLVSQGVLAGFSTPARFLPSQATQSARQQSLPDDTTLRARMNQALDGLPISASKLEGFFEDVSRARNGPLISAADLAGSSSALVLESLLTRKADGWSALIPLRAPQSGPHAHDIDAATLRATLQQSHAQVGFIDLSEQTGAIYTSYLSEAIQTAVWGSLAVLLVISLALRDARRITRVCIPLVAAVTCTIALLVADGSQLNMLHLIGLLLVVAIGSNYVLFFDQAPDKASAEQQQRTLLSLLLANLTTVTAFGLLASSSVPVLATMGSTVAPGAFLALVFAAALTPRPAADGAPG